MSRSAIEPALLERVERLYAQAKSGKWDDVWLALAGERELAAACSRYAKPSSGWTFLHQAAYAGNDASVKGLLRLGASLSATSKERATACEVAGQRGHAALEALMRHAAVGATGLWEPSSAADLLPSSSAWAEHAERRAWRELRVSYGGGCVLIPVGGRHYVDSFERILVGWHGTYDPPAGMDGESMF
jgi:hypothetical protein